MHTFILPLVASLPLVVAQSHLAVLGADGISVGYHTNSSDLAAGSVAPKKTQVGVIQPAQSLSIQSQPSEGHSIDSWAAVQSSHPIGPLTTPPGAPDINAISEKPTEWQNHAGQPEPDAAHPMGFWILNRNAMKHHVSADFAAEDFATYGSHEYLKFSTTTIGPGENLWIPTLPGVSPKLYVGVSPNNNTAEVGSHRNHDTLIEASFEGGYGHLYYDIDIERGFSSPVWCHGQGDTWENGRGCVADLLSVCPVKDQHHHPVTGLYDQCRGAADNVDFRRHYCPESYVLFNDDWNTKGTGNRDGKRTNNNTFDTLYRY